jgi:hypothetical protein
MKFYKSETMHLVKQQPQGNKKREKQPKSNTYKYHKIVATGNSGSAVYGMNCLRPLNTRIAGSNPTQGADICVCVYSVFVLFCL